VEGYDIGPARACIEPIQHVLAAARDAGCTIIHTREGHRPDLSDLPPAKKVRGLLCLGYPFHPPGKPDQLRTAHLESLRTPTLICQGTRDPFGSREEVVSYTLSDRIDLLWLEDGDHDLKPRKKISGYFAGDHMRRLSEYTAAWAERL